MTKRFNIYSTAKLAIVAGLMAFAPGLASAQAPHCYALTGSYAFKFSGTQIFPGSTTPVPFNGVGITTFDGAGRWTSVESANFGAFVVRNSPLSGTYTLNANCTGTMTTTFPDGTTGHQDFVLADAGQTLYGVGVDNVGPGVLLSATGIRMLPAK
jgi:hypothetical protein